MKHTQEPWKFEKTEGSVNDGWEAQLIPATGPDSDWHSFVVAFGFGDPDYREIAEANARRIVACVNALAGIENPDEYIASIRAETIKEAADRAVAWLADSTSGIDPALAATNSGKWLLKLRENQSAALRAAIMGEPK